MLNSERLDFSTGVTSYRLLVAGSAADLAWLVGQPLRLVEADLETAAPTVGEVGASS